MKTNIGKDVNRNSRNIWLKVLAVVLALVLAAIVIVGCLWGFGVIWRTEDPDEETGISGMEITESDAYGISLCSSQNEDESYILTVELDNGACWVSVEWSMTFADESSDWASGKKAEDYVDLEVVDGILAAQVTCLAPFGEQIVITVTCVEYPDIYAKCTLDYWADLESVSIFVCGLEGEEIKNVPFMTFDYANEVMTFVIPSDEDLKLPIQNYDEDNDVMSWDAGLDAVYGTGTKFIPVDEFCLVSDGICNISSGRMSIDTSVYSSVFDSDTYDEILTDLTLSLYSFMGWIDDMEANDGDLPEDFYLSVYVMFEYFSLNVVVAELVGLAYMISGTDVAFYVFPETPWSIMYSELDDWGSSTDYSEATPSSMTIDPDHLDFGTY